MLHVGKVSAPHLLFHLLVVVPEVFLRANPVPGLWGKFGVAA